MNDLNPVAIFERRKRIVEAIAKETEIIKKALVEMEVIQEARAEELAQIDDAITETREIIDSLELAEQSILDTLTHDQRCAIINGA